MEKGERKMKIVGYDECEPPKKGELFGTRKEPIDLYVLMTQEEYIKCVLAINGKEEHKVLETKPILDIDMEKLEECIKDFRDFDGTITKLRDNDKVTKITIATPHEFGETIQDTLEILEEIKNKYEEKRRK